MTTVLLAAGRSRRFGWANKLLAPVGGRPLVALTVARVLAATRGPVIVVTDHQARALRAALVRHGVISNRLRIVHAPGARHDMAAARARGLAAAPRIASALQIHLADVPYFDSRLNEQLRRTIHRGARATRPVHGGVPGHPVRFRRDLLSPRIGSAAGSLFGLPASAWHRIDGPPGCVRDIDYRSMIRNLNCE